MPKKRIPKTWQQLERNVADILSPIFGIKLFRNILSGSNNRQDDGSPRYGDVAMPEGIKMIVECKYRSGISFHRFFDQAQSDAEKANIPLINALVFSKEKGKKPILVTMHSDLFKRLLEIARESNKLTELFGFCEKSQ